MLVFGIILYHRPHMHPLFQRLYKFPTHNLRHNLYADRSHLTDQPGEVILSDQIFKLQIEIQNIL